MSALQAGLGSCSLPYGTVFIKRHTIRYAFEPFLCATRAPAPDFPRVLIVTAPPGKGKGALPPYGQPHEPGPRALEAGWGR